MRQIATVTDRRAIKTGRKYDTDKLKRPVVKLKYVNKFLRSQTRII
jgi:hypothetical protein